MAGRTAYCHGGKLPDADKLRKLVSDGYGKRHIAERYGVSRDHEKWVENAEPFEAEIFPWENPYMAADVFLSTYPALAECRR